MNSLTSDVFKSDSIIAQEEIEDEFSTYILDYMKNPTINEHNRNSIIETAVIDLRTKNS